MSRVEKSVLVPHSAEKMWALVENVPEYPQFLPWCSAIEIHERSPERAVATLHINFHGLHQQFTTRNRSQPGSTLTMELVRGPFRHLRGEFRFVPLQEHACKILFALEWTFSSRLLEKIVGPVFHKIANSMVDAFVQRANRLKQATIEVGVSPPPLSASPAALPEHSPASGHTAIPGSGASIVSATMPESDTGPNTALPR